MRRVTAGLFIAFAFLAAGASLVLSAAANASGGTVYTAAAPVLDTIEGGPWNTSQGDPSAGGEYPSADLLPTFSFGGPETTLGEVSEPNVAVYPGEQKVIEGGKEVTKLIPYPSGVAGTPGPLDGYCSSLGANPETGSPVSQPAGSKLPFSPYYFPDIVRNADGSLTGYFDYRPKDADEAITVARSTDGGRTWIAEGKALEQNPGYCPTADTNDDGQGHPYVAPIGGSTKLYTLNRPAGDYEGVGLLVHNVEPSAADPLGSLPASEPVGIDPNTYAEVEVEVPTTGGAGASIPVSTLGESGSPEHIVAGPYIDYTHNSPTSGSAPAIITCTGTSATPAELTGCTVAGGSALTVKAKDDIVQVIATANPEEVTSKEPKPGATYTIPAGPNSPSGEGGLAEVRILNGNSTVSPLTTFILNENAPNRVYIDGVTVYCAQSNANPTTKIENCTSADGSPLTVHQGDPITADPIVPPDATVTTGLKAPDGIVGTLPSYPGAPSGSTVVLYTEKELAYFIVGTTDGSVSSSGKYTAGSVTLPLASGADLTYTPSVHPSEPLPATGSFKIYLGTNIESPIQEVTCTGVAPATQSGVPAGSENLSGCTGGSGKVAEGNWIGGPNAATVPFSTLNKIGEGKDSKSKGPEKLFNNNEDLSVLRAAYTYNGVNFTDLGPISGTTPGAVNDKGEYTGISNPYQQASPRSSAEPSTATTEPVSPTDLTPGSADEVELRYIGSRGTIITNPNGTYGMFLSGSWASDGDSDAFNQIFYTESSNGKEWSTPKVVLSTEYEFAASREQDEALAHGEDKPLGVSAYYSGRAYGPAVVQNPNGSLTMVFSGYRLPKPITTAGTELGTGSSKYTIGAKDPALYRNILTMDLTSSTSPGVSTSTSVSASDEGSGVVEAPVTYTATVSPVAPGTGTPTGTVSFSDSHGPISGCSEVKLNEGSPDMATCATTHERPGGTDEVTATYSGDSNYAGSSGTTSETVAEEAPTITSPSEATFNDHESSMFAVTATGAPAPTITKWGTLPEGITFSDGVLSGTPTQTGTFEITFTASNGIGAPSTQQFLLTVAGLHITTTSLREVTPGVAYNQPLHAVGGIEPYTWHKTSGRLPSGIKLNSKTGELYGTVAIKKHGTPSGSFPITVKVTDSTKRVHQTATAEFTLDVS